MDRLQVFEEDRHLHLVESHLQNKQQVIHKMAGETHGGCQEWESRSAPFLGNQMQTGAVRRALGWDIQNSQEQA